jgi:hypothetical protein
MFCDGAGAGADVAEQVCLRAAAAAPGHGAVPGGGALGARRGDGDEGRRWRGGGGGGGAPGARALPRCVWAWARLPRRFGCWPGRVAPGCLDAWPCDAIEVGIGWSGAFAAAGLALGAVGDASVRSGYGERAAANTVFSHTVPCVHHILCCVCVMAVSPSAETAFQDAGERPFRQTEWWLKPSKSFIVVSGAMGGYPASAWFCKPSCLILSVSRLTLSVSCRVLSVSCLVYHMQSHIFCSQSTTSPPAPPPPERSARPLRCAPTPGA